MESMDYKPNSHKSKDEQAATEDRKKIEKVVRGNVKLKKKNGIGKFANLFISEDAKNVKSYVFLDVLIPAVKKAISDIVTDGIDMVLYGGSGRGKKRSTASTISYRDYYDRGRDRRFDEPRAASHANIYSYDDIVFETKADAEDVLDRMGELIERYRQVTVADLYDMVGVSGNYTDNRYGWTDISSVRSLRSRDGYVLDLPKAKVL